MNRVKRDYCAKGLHTNWRAWRARYDMTTWRWFWVGNYCEYCGQQVSQCRGSPPDYTREQLDRRYKQAAANAALHRVLHK